MVNIAQVSRAIKISKLGLRGWARMSHSNSKRNTCNNAVKPFEYHNSKRNMIMYRVGMLRANRLIARSPTTVF